MHSLFRKQLKTFVVLAGSDLLALLLAVLMGLLVRTVVLPGVSVLFTTETFWRIEYLWLLLIGLFVFLYEGLYTRRRTLWEEFRYVLRGVTVTMILFLALMTLLKSGADVSRPALVLSYGFAPGMIIGFRRLVKKQLIHGATFWIRRILIAGINESSLQLSEQLARFPELGMLVIGFADNCERDNTQMPTACLGTLHELDQIILNQAVDELIIALPGESRLRQFELLTTAEALVPKVSVLPEMFDADKLNVEVEKIERYFLLSFHNNLMKRSNRLAKNLFEILVVVVSCPVWLPLLLVLAAIVKLTSAGPIFFRQQRVGKLGIPFVCLKFRTMVEAAEDVLKQHLETDLQAQAEWNADRKLKNDPRITAVGRFLRRTSLDELPQMINVLRGEMSLIGPRPIVADEIVRYADNFRYYESVCPGLSGLWQVSGRNDVDYKQRVMLDTFYVRNWSLWLDFMILLRTLPAVFKKDGAY